MARAASARVSRGRDSPQARGGGGSGAFDTDCQRTAYAEWGADIAMVTGVAATDSVSTTGTEHAAAAHPAGIVGQHGCWP